MEQNFKIFGIYVNDFCISVVISIENDLIFGVDYPLDDYFEEAEELSNVAINNWLEENFDIIGSEQIFKTYPDDMKNDGYIGQVNDTKLQEKIKELVIQVWSFECDDDRFI